MAARPAQVLCLAVLVGCGRNADAPVTCRSRGLDEVSRWREHLALEARDGFSGAVLVADGDRIVFQQEYGTAAADSGPTAFWIASISKVVTSVAVLRLVEDGRLELHAPLSRYLPDVPGPWQDVTVHHLLAHRAGFPTAYPADGVADRGEALRRLMDQKPAKQMGEFAYSNDGYAVLAILVETVAGEPYEATIRHLVFEPAGMDRAGFWGFEPAPSPVAPPAHPQKTDRMRPTIWRDRRSVANWGYRGPTGIYATPEDLFRLSLALRKGLLLSPGSFQSMITSKNPAIGPNAQTYGYGVALRVQDGRVVEYWHGGNEDWLGHNGMFKTIGDRLIVVLSNSGDLDSGSWAHRIEEGVRACADR